MNISDEARELIDAIISAYHTTRLKDAPVADHILSKAPVRAAFQRAIDAETERCAAKAVEALWPILGGNHTDAADWQTISDAIAAAIRSKP